MDRLTTDDGRRVDFVVEGPAGAPLLVVHHGTPGAAVLAPTLSAAARARGLRVLCYSRPGYGGSDAAPGRLVAGAGPDVAALLRHLGVDTFVCAGWSGGGPHALAAAATAGPGLRCRAVAVLAGLAPHDADGLDWTAGMGAENLAEFGLATEGFAALDAGLRSFGLELRDASVDEIVAGMRGLLTPPDIAALDAGMGETLAASVHLALQEGVAGWRDDDLAFVTGWGFGLDAVTCPVTVWQGGADLMVPAAHGHWLASRLAGAQLRAYPGHGHLSLVAELADEIVGGLAASF
jgi:pimeloyl-ACP methyl ester carboxylesterase